MDLPSAHIAVLGHRDVSVADVSVAEMIGTDARRQPLVVNQRGDRLAEAVGGRFGDAQLFPRRAPLLVIVVAVWQASSASSKDADDRVIVRVARRT